MRGVIWALIAAHAAAAQFPVCSHTLENGMKVIVAEDHTIPNVAVQFFFRVGSRNERPGITGISHFLEHMMFNGARRYGPRQFDAILESNGGDNNAYTTRDVTAYTDWVPRDAMELLIGMEADRIQNLAFAPALIESERGVVVSERRSNVDDSNLGLLLEQLYATAYVSHPYRWPVLGWVPDIASWTAGDLAAHYRMGYSPGNCVMVTAGAASSEEVMRLARRYLEPIPSHAPPPPLRAVEPRQLRERRVTVRKPVQMPGMLIGYHVPASNHADWWPLQMLATVLADGRSSRLYGRLVDREQAAVSVSAWLQHTLDPGLLIFRLQPRQAAAAERAFDEEIARIREAPPGAGELEKARNQLLAEYYRQMRTNSGKAELLADAEIYFGDYRKVFAAPAEIERVAAADVRRVARQYLDPANRTVALLAPAEAP